MWMTSFPEAMGWGFWVIFLKKAVSWDLKLDELSWDSDMGDASWFLSLGEARPVGSTRCTVRGVVRWNSQHSKNCVSLSSCWKSKSQEDNKSFVPELARVISVWGFIRMRTFHVSVYLYSGTMAIQHSVKKLNGNYKEFCKIFWINSESSNLHYSKCKVKQLPYHKLIWTRLAGPIGEV